MWRYVMTQLRISQESNWKRRTKKVKKNFKIVWFAKRKFQFCVESLKSLQALQGFESKFIRTDDFWRFL